MQQSIESRPGTTYGRLGRASISRSTIIGYGGQMQVHGRCHCGRITYSAEADPERVTICHCTDCQGLSGGAFRVALPVATAGFRLLSGSPKTYIKTAESGTKRIHSFCPDCGTPIYSAALVDPPFHTLRVGCLQERVQLAPRRQIWCRSSVPWSSDITAVSRSERGA